jgi:anhydro-N-acetylmuramic acid kinase
MIYRAIGMMSGSSLDGVDLVFASFESKGQQWIHEIHHTECIPYSGSWKNKLRHADQLSAIDYLQLHIEYGKYIGQLLQNFIEKYALAYKVQLISIHGHTVFHQPSNGFTHQLGEGAVIAAITGIPVIADLRTMDIAFSGQGAPLVPMGEKKLFSGNRIFLNIGGIANLSVHNDTIIGFDICPANRILNTLAEKEGVPFDDKGSIARSGKVNPIILEQLNALNYYQQPYPKSLSNQYGEDVVLPILNRSGLSTTDTLATYTEHIAIQIRNACKPFIPGDAAVKPSMMITGGGAFNEYLIERIRHHLPELEIIIPEEKIIQFKEALIMALIGVLRWREEPTALSSVTGARKDSIGGAIWSGHQ